MSLEIQLERAQRQVRTDSLSMSIGELASMYENKELTINPVFQRLFRWEQHQKSKLVESILLGIPIPPIFLFETKIGSWELIDGLQRISTIFEFMGVLRDAKTWKLQPPSHMTSTIYLPSFDNVVWTESDRIRDVAVGDQQELPRPMQFEFKRARLNLQILKRPSDAHTKYDLFQRLNSGGSIATPQEIRNCAVIMASEEFFHVLEDMSQLDSFRRVSRITGAGRKIQKPMEFVTRFVGFLRDNFDPSFDVEEYIDKKIIYIADSDDSIGEVTSTFNNTFDLLFEAAGNDALRRYDPVKQTFTGQVGQVALESVAIGVARNLDSILKRPNPVAFVLDRIKGFWAQPEVSEFSKAGVSGSRRLQSTLPFGALFFRP
ncbi:MULTISPECIES: DUF262 domain-containing protein [unclassified Mesorhizobium]|uniref:DUF262 domain-containing protein n=1 Tax=unclassified Mesorhizobium TaxID=325217 RepID=UPI000F74FE6B|nr:MULTISPECIES: DUF262 domain-containing protein [unclassified Mesorhizobium]TIU56333.1 MAG: DUF262 domain-containing protein [Mesorhizobium sp.]AZO02618.1 DUF262 domain-containing protein [Mesorhizobium sp. M2A.F.Ca.ET.043.02.1.1]RUW69696.1 DUF262 domain-containing protein [Mesorhizobium sp. M2A.F.Ca.ET.067.02.1.1]TIV37462.1 MAG: DUF262 domain-containing protein [Mesorhizobium sp.]TIW88273.1 MAG: DUF262 domain-containing protein [Mesorhizobium sp.]